MSAISTDGYVYINGNGFPFFDCSAMAVTAGFSHSKLNEGITEFSGKVQINYGNLATL